MNVLCELGVHDFEFDYSFSYVGSLTEERWYYCQRCGVHKVRVIKKSDLWEGNDE